MKRVGSRLVAALALSVALTSAAILAIPAQSGATSASLAGSASNLDVVGGPIAVGSTAVVVSVDQQHVLHLDGVDPVTDNLVWQHPYSASAITAGVALTPAASGSTVMDLVPAISAGNPAVELVGVDAATGSLAWRGPGAAVVSDNPSSCVSGADLCVPVYNADNSSSLVVINGASGSVDRMLKGPNRAIGTGLYESDAQTPTFEQISSAGTVAWTEPVSSFFGPGYDPNYGWNIQPVGGLDVGSVAPTVSGSTMNLSTNKTVGFSIANGTPQWTLPGSYQCMGALAVLSTQVTCQFSGTIHKPTSAKATPSLNGVGLKLVGFDPTSGSTTWSMTVHDFSPLITASGVRFIDATHLLVQTAAGKSVDLDTSTGTTVPVKSRQVAWCEKMPTYRVVTMKGTPGNGQRSGQPVVFPCTPSGNPTNAPPPSSPSTVGITIDGIFVWPSPTGLQTHTINGSHLNA